LLRRLMMRMRRRRMMMVGGQGGEGGGRRRKGKWIKLPAGREERGVMAKSLQLLHDPRGRRVAGSVKKEGGREGGREEGREG